MPAQEHIESQIQAYIEGTCTGAESTAIRNLIENDLRWRQSYGTMQALDNMLKHDLEIMEPSMRFSKNVMEEIAGLPIAKPVRLRSNPWIFRIAGGTLGILLFFIVGYSVINLDLSSVNELPRLPVPEVSVPSINWANYLNNGITVLLFMVFIVLAYGAMDNFLKSRQKKLKH